MKVIDLVFYLKKPMTILALLSMTVTWAVVNANEYEPSLQISDSGDKALHGASLKQSKEPVIQLSVKGKKIVPAENSGTSLRQGIEGTVICSYDEAGKRHCSSFKKTLGTKAE